MRTPWKFVVVLVGWVFACAETGPTGASGRLGCPRCAVRRCAVRRCAVRRMCSPPMRAVRRCASDGCEHKRRCANCTDAMATADGGTLGDAVSEAAVDSGIQLSPYGSIVPLYTDPSDSSWTAIATAAQSHPTVSVVAIINPQQWADVLCGVELRDRHTEAAIRRRSRHCLCRDGLRVSGAQRCGARHRPLSLAIPVARGDLLRRSGRLRGPGHETLYMQYAQYARAAGLSFVVANPGTAPMSQYLPLFDVTMVYETGGTADPASLATYACQPHRVGMFAYGVQSVDAAYVTSVRTDVNWIYLTNDTLPNPYDTLPPYFSDLLTALGS